MPRRMYDSVTASNCPADGDLYLGYVDGQWPSYNDMVRLFPNAKHVSCTVSGAHRANVGDCEYRDMTPSGLVAWVRWMRSLGDDPTGYCSFGLWDECKQAFARAFEPEPHWLIAGYAQPPDPTIPPGAVGHQYADVGPYDVSSVADYWPGVDPSMTTGEAMAAFNLVACVLDPQRNPDSLGRHPFWGIDRQGHTYALNGARTLPSPISGHDDICDLVYLPSVDRLVAIADDGHQEPGGEWAASTFELTPAA